MVNEALTNAKPTGKERYFNYRLSWGYILGIYCLEPWMTLDVTIDPNTNQRRESSEI